MSEPEKYTILDTSGERRVVGRGLTTDTPSGIPAFKDPVKEFMCIVMCACKKLFEDNAEAPEITTDDVASGPDAIAASPETESTATAKPPRLQQNCVATLFQSLDAAADYKSWVKAEVSYDIQGYKSGFMHMGDKTALQPQPLMSRKIPTRPLYWHWGVISHVGRRKNPALSQPLFVKGGKSLRRPDIVIVRDPALPPVGDNIAMIYEMKFEDQVNSRQLRAYRRIVGNDDSRVQLLQVKDCSCEKRRGRLREVTREELLAWAATMTALLTEASRNGGRPSGGMAPVHIKTGLEVLGAIAVAALAVAALPAEVPAGIAAFFALTLAHVIAD